MSDPRVTSCPHQKKTESGKIRCIFPGRSYYFCKTNRRDNECPLGLSTTYDDPEPLQERPFKSSIEESIRYFHEHHRTDRWNLKDRMDSYLLYYQLDNLQVLGNGTFPGRPAQEISLRVGETRRLQGGNSRSVSVPGWERKTIERRIQKITKRDKRT